MRARTDSADWSAPPGLTLRDWVRGSDGSGRPARADRRRPDYHLSTLFPPVRPRGHFELRMIDAQPGDGWIVPLAVASALLSDAQAADAALAAAERLWHPDGANGEDPWLRAASVGPAHPRIAGPAGSASPSRATRWTAWRAPAEITAAVDAFIDGT